MTALGYLFVKTLKNAIIGLFKKPGALILYLLLIGMIVVSFVFSGGAPTPPTARNTDVFYAFVLGMYALIFALSIMQGTKRGTAIFKMPDVNLLFTSPVRSDKILVYGLLKQAGIMVAASLFMIAQYPNIRINFGLGGDALAGFMIGYCLLGLCAQLISVNLYAFCASSPERRSTVERVLKIPVILVLAGLAYFVFTKGDVGTALRTFFGGDFWNFVPVLGWCRAIVAFASVGNWGLALLFVGLMLLACGGCVMFLVRTNSDYYEDVLVSAESARDVAAAAKSGRFSFGSDTVSKRVKREMAPLRGEGASAFFYRILRERSRKGSWFLDMPTAGAAAVPLLARVIFGTELVAEAGMWPVFALVAYIMIFLMLTNTVAQEFARPYLHIAPAGSFAKLAAICAPHVLKQGLEAFVFAVVSYFAFSLAPQDAVFAGLTYWSIAALYTSGILLVQKLLGGYKTAAVVMILYILILLVLVAPGIVGAIILQGLIGTILGYCVCIAWNAIVFCAIVAICSNLVGNQQS
ncbi:MAG: putative ABC exporter domain-containing protein [Bacillota bacterium]